MPKQNKVVVNLVQDFTEAEKAQARQNIGAASVSDVSDVTEVVRTDLRGSEIDISKLNFVHDGADQVKIIAGAANVGNTVPTPTLDSQEGKVPVAYHRDGRGYFLLEQYKDPRLPDSGSVDEGKVLTVDAHGSALWTPPSRLPVVRSNIAFTLTSSDESTRTWTSPTIVSPSGEYAWMSYYIYVSGVSFTSNEKWSVKNNGSNWTTGIYGNFSSYVCGVPSTGVTFTLITPLTVTDARFSYVLYQDWA